MARTISVIGPTGLATPTLDLVAANDTVTQAVTLAEATNAKGKYSGTLTAGAGNYAGVLKTAETVVGTFGYVRVQGGDPEAVEVGDVAGVPDGIKLGKAITRTHGTSGDTLPETISET